MKLSSLFEKKADPASGPFIDKICRLLFGISSGEVRDSKRAGEFYGVANQLSSITDKNGNHLTLTFDNSTASGEFELNSLAPLQIIKGSQLDLELAKMHREHDIPSVKKLGYIQKGNETVLREIYFGKILDENAINFLVDLLANLKHGDGTRQVKENTSAYGFCPICNKPGITTERRINGNSICENSHAFKRPQAE